MYKLHYDNFLINEHDDDDDDDVITVCLKLFYANNASRCITMAGEQTARDGTGHAGSA